MNFSSLLHIPAIVKIGKPKSNHSIILLKIYRKKFKCFLIRIAKFSQYDSKLNRYLVSMPLIAQLGKNYSHVAKVLGLTGNNLLELAFAKILDVQRTVGGKTTYIECASNPRLFEFYSNNGFVQFGERKKEKEELSESLILIQMLRYF